MRIKMMSCKNTIRRLLLFGFMSMSLASLAQNVDYGTWLGAELKHQISKKLTVGLNAELRVFDTLNKVDEFLIESAVKFNLIKHIDLIGFYRFSRSFDDDWGFFNEHRLTGGVVFWVKPGRFKISLQEKMQFGFKNIYQNGINILETKILRSKFITSYNIPKSKLNPYISAEVYYDLSPFNQMEFSKGRYKLGVEYDLKRKFSLDIFLQFQHKLNTQKQYNLFAVGFTIGYQIPAAKSENTLVEQLK